MLRTIAPKRACRAAGIAPLALALALASVQVAARAGSPAGLEAELRTGALEALEKGSLPAFLLKVESRLKELLAEKDAIRTRGADLEALEHYRNVARFFAATSVSGSAENRKFLAWLIGQRTFCSRFLHAMGSGDVPSRAVAVLRKLKAIEGQTEKQFLDHSEMAIAFAVIWDTYRWHYWTRLEVPAERMEEVWKHYVTNGPRLRTDPRKLTHELLRHVVDHPLTKEERDFVMANYANRGDLGTAFKDIKWVMSADSLAQNRKRNAPYTLVNIKKYNGVCMEQAYYCACVAKVLGVPAVYLCGKGKRGGHAWTGMLEMRGGSPGWNMSVGRYWYDRYWRGYAFDPAYRRRARTDGEIMMTAGLLNVPVSRREAADARRGVALWLWMGTPGIGAKPVRLKKPEKPGQTIPPPAELTAEKKKRVHDLLLEAVKLNPFDRRNWLMAGYAAATGTFNLDQVQTFSDLMFRSLGRISPDFACRRVQTFLYAVPDRAVRNRIYETCFNYFRSRPDLAAELKVSQGRMWDADGDAGKALQAYVQAVASFPNDGHVTSMAVSSITSTLEKMKDNRKAAETLKGLWNTMMNSVPSGKRDKHEALRIVGEKLIHYLKAADMKRDLAAFEPAFRQVFPPQPKKK
ncbi:MAG: hypothetical protein ACYTGB_14855 [Planctomycetota bacterium]|jgi:hypothetical protein